MENLLTLTASQLNKQLSTPEQRDVWLSNLIDLGELLKPGAPVLDQMAINALLDLYSELLSEIGPERFVAAYKLVLKTSKFRPDSSELYIAAGVLTPYPIEQEAKAEFRNLIKLMRHHGRKLANRGNPPADPPRHICRGCDAYDCRHGIREHIRWLRGNLGTSSIGSGAATG
jgi:hypothetical protein